MRITGASDADRAAAPVIGIVLLVAITVVVGAVVAGFTFDLGRNSTDSMPNAQLSVEDASDVLASNSEADDVFLLSHDSGADVKTDNLLFIVRQDGSEETRSVVKAMGTDASDILDATSGGQDIETVNELETGNEVVISEVSDGDFSSGTYDITIVHEPSEGILLEQTVKVD